MTVMDKLTKDFEGLSLPSKPSGESYKNHKELQQRCVKCVRMLVHIYCIKSILLLKTGRSQKKG